MGRKPEKGKWEENQKSSIHCHPTRSGSLSPSKPGPNWPKNVVESDESDKN